ncbi:MAG: glycoside hydrolase/phage tail family protein [Pseudomonadota bacterium]
MATLALTAAGSVAGSTLLPAGVSVLGATISGAAIGQAVGSIAGNYIDQALFGSSGQSRIVEGARLSDLQVLASTEGAALPRLYGRARIGGQIIWATALEEDIIKTTSQSSSAGGKGLLSSSAPSTTQIDYKYYANFAVSLCEGVISRIGRVWADGKELDLSSFTYRIYKGTETQLPDSLIEAKEGAGHVPAYRGTAYIVFERLPLERFGNRIPQLTFEVFRSVDDFSSKVQAVTIIPGAGEFAYETTEVTRTENGSTIPENVHTRQGGTNWTVALNDLEDSLGNLKSAALIVSWFGTDLRASQCQIQPGVENVAKVTTPKTWSVAGQTRNTAYTVSLKDGDPAFGGTPSDASVIAAIKDLNTRGIKATFYPFILMDIPDGNSLIDPYSSASSQPVYPWRGRITVDPAPGLSGTPDKTSAATSQVNSLVGAAQVSDFSISGETVTYTGPAEWTLRRMVLHYAHVCKAAGGIDTFLLSSELRGLTQVRDSASNYPFVNALVQLAADVKSVLGSGAKVTYAADWSEYFGYHPQDSSNDVYFHLDPLWSSANIDAIGVDLYWPLSDWRDGTSHLDYQAGIRSIYDPSYLKGNVNAGEGYDWYYANTSDRAAQTRTNITDGSGKPWVFRYKDILSWWNNQHYDRPGGAESGTPTAWVPKSKPIWFTELGCPAVDKGSNQPNVFYDPKSSESFFPYFSKGTRDDAIQRAYIKAFLEYFDPNNENYISGSNPISSIYSDRMVDLERIYVYTWDARPYPAFPFNNTVWGDTDNWEFGHWITGRIGDAPLAQTINQIMSDYDFSDFDTTKLHGTLQGILIDRIMSARDALQPLELSYFIDSFESGGKVHFKHRGQESISKEIAPDDLVEDTPGADLYVLKRAQETELPAIAKLSYIDSANEYRQAAVDARRQVIGSQRVSSAQLPIIVEQQQAQNITEVWLHDIWAARETGEFSLPPSYLALEPSDMVQLKDNASEPVLRLAEVTEGNARLISSLSIEPSVYDTLRTPKRQNALPSPQVFGATTLAFMDLPLISGNENPAIGYVAAFQSPWPGGVALYRSPDTSGYTLNALATSPATLGVTQTALSSGPTGRLDYGNELSVKLDSGTLSSVENLALLGGQNSAAIQNANGDWEVLQFKNAVLTEEKTYTLSVLLRGQAGTENAMQGSVPIGARFVLLDEAIAEVGMSANEIGLPFNWKYGPSNRNISHQSYTTSSHAFTGLGFKPLSPVHVKASWSGNDLILSWIRRTRIGGDSWEIPEVPLGEDTELYEIDILNGSAVIRTLTSTTTHVTYAETQQIADWITVQSSYDINLYQLSGMVGRGSPRQETVGA